MISITRIKNKNLTIQVPPSKAHTLRALILGALAEGTTTVRNPLLGEDQLHLIDCLKGLGVAIEQNGNVITVRGSGGRFDPVADSLNCGESGVAMNFLSTVACLSAKPVTLTGKEGLLKRPVDEVVSGVRQIGGDVAYAEREGFPPLLATPSGIAGGTATMKGERTSQYFSSLTIAAACAKKDVTILCSDDMSEKPYFDITVDMMRRFGVEAKNVNYKTIAVRAGQKYRAVNIDVESDYSSSSYFVEAAAITGATLKLKGLARDSVQGDRKIIDYAKTMGCAVEYDADGVTVTGTGMKPIDESFCDTPDLVPTVALMAAFAPGTSYLRDVAHLKFKECDRVAAIIDGLTRMEIVASVEGKDLVVEGNPKAARGAAISSYNDHRIAMSFAVAGLVLDGQTIDEETCVRKSFPNFWDVFATFTK